MGNHTELNDKNFEEEVLKSDIPVIVDFWAEWCAPCRLVGPIVEELAGEYAGKVKVGKLNVDLNSQSSMSYGIRSIPTLLFFKDGKPVDQILGAVPKNAIEERLKALL